MVDMRGDDFSGLIDRAGPRGLRAGRHWRAIFSMVAILATAFVPSTVFATLADEIQFDVADLRAEDQDAVEALAGYPDNERRGALIVAGEPEALLAIEEIQRDSAQKFGDLVATYPRAVQETVWDLVRFPDLAAELAGGGRKNEAALGKIADRFPAEIRDSIMASGKDHYPLWVSIYALELEAKQDYRALLQGQSESLKAAFDVVEQRPDLLNLLAENMHMTTVLGAGYRDDPQGVEKHFAALAHSVALKKQEQEREWADELQDPEAAEELRRAAQEFADEHGYAYREGYQDGASDERRYSRDAYPAYAYPYWFGYPSWYQAAYWYPRSISRHVGFHYRQGYSFRNGHSFVSVGLPSLLFLNWYHGSYYPRHYGKHRINARSQGNAHRRTVRYFDRHRPHRSASHRRHASAIGRKVRFEGQRSDRGWNGRSDRDRRIDRDRKSDRRGKIGRDRKHESRRDVDRKTRRHVRQDLSRDGKGRSRSDLSRENTRRQDRELRRDRKTDPRVEGADRKRSDRRENRRDADANRSKKRPALSPGKGGRLKSSGDRSGAKRGDRIARDQKRTNKGVRDAARNRPHVSAGPRRSVDRQANRSERRIEKKARVRPSANPARIGGNKARRERRATQSAKPRKREASQVKRKSSSSSERRARPMAKRPRAQKKSGGSSGRMRAKNRDSGRRHQGNRGGGGRRGGQRSGGRNGR